MLPPSRRRALEHSILTGLGFRDWRQESTREMSRGGKGREAQGFGAGGEMGWGRVWHQSNGREWPMSSCKGGGRNTDSLTGSAGFSVLKTSCDIIIFFEKAPLTCRWAEGSAKGYRA